MRTKSCGARSTITKTARRDARSRAGAMKISASVAAIAIEGHHAFRQTASERAKVTITAATAAMSATIAAVRRSLSSPASSFAIIAAKIVMTKTAPMKYFSG